MPLPMPMSYFMRMKLERTVIHESGKPPPEFLADLKEATIPFESIFDLNDPLGGYGKGLKESFVGDKTILARIKDSEARLMPFGQWPIKGKNPTASAGYLSCKVGPADRGSTITAGYVFPIFNKIAMFLFAGIFVLLVAAIVLLGMFGANIDGRNVLMAAAGFGCFVVTFLIIFTLGGAKKQSRLTHEFLTDFVAKEVS